MDTTAVASIIAGCGGIATGIIGSAIVLGRRYEALLQQWASLSEKVEDMKQDLAEHKSEERKRTALVNDLVAGVNTQVATLNTSIAVFNANLQNCAKREDITEVLERLSHIEGVLNGRQRKE